MTKAALPRHTDTRAAPPITAIDCPVLDGAAVTRYRECVKAANSFSLDVKAWLEDRTAEEKVAWLKTAVSSSRPVFQPWSMEILYVIAVLGRARFSELHDLLGMSTRTLSDKLKTLREEGFIDREVFDEQPVRIEYTLTKHGSATVALASPLFARLNLEAVKQANRQ